MPAYAFVDESKSRGLVMVAAVVQAHDSGLCRKVIRSLLLPNQRRLHFSKERSSRQRQIARGVDELPFHAWVLEAPTQLGERSARRLAVERMALELIDAGVAGVVLETDESLVRSDRASLYRVVHANGATNTFTYEHRRPHEEPLLWLPDAIAWCWTKGGRHRAWIASRVTRRIGL